MGLSQEHRALQELARDVARDHLSPMAAAVDAESRFPESSLQALVAAELHAIGIPDAYGGQGGDILASVLVAEELARACATTQQVAGGNELFAWPLVLFGSEELKQRYLQPVAAGTSLGAFALTEPEAGSDVAALSTRATPVEGGWLLKGTKRWITNAGRADVYVVFAKTDRDAGHRGISAFVVESGDEAMTFGGLEKKMGLRGSPTREIVLDNVFVPSERLIGQPGEGLKIALATLDRTRVIVAAQAVGIAQGALDYTTEYLRNRQQFSRPVASFQGVQFMVADLDIALRAARALTYAAAEEAEAQSRQMGPAGAAAKCFASDTAMRVTTDCVQLLGGAGYVSDHPVERMMRDAKITQIYEGTNQIQRLVVARALLQDQ